MRKGVAIGILLSSVALLFLGFIVLLALFAWPTNDMDNKSPARQAEMIRIIEKSAGLPPIPKTATITTVNTEGNSFSRGFCLVFTAKPQVIKKWMSDAKGLSERGEVNGKDRRYLVQPKDGYQFCEVIVNHSYTSVEISLSWS